MSAGAPTAGAAVLRVLRLGLHVGFASLLAVGLIRVAATEGTARAAWAAVVAAALGGVYLAGTVWEHRFATGRAGDPGRHARTWLAAVVLLWLVLMAMHPDFSWLAFPLFFLQLHLLSRPAAVSAVCLTTAAVVAGQWFHAGSPSLPMLVGPVVGAVFAVVMAMAYRALYEEGVAQHRALEELRRARAALAREQHRAGVLAERTRLARDIHDTLAQGFSSIVLLARAADHALAAGDAPLAAQRLETVGEVASQNLAEAREFVRGAAPSAPDGGALDAAGLAARLGALCAAAERTAEPGGGLDCHFRQDGEARLLPQETARTLVRAAQSCLANVVAHAGARRAVVTLGYLPGEVVLDVYDDGAGFDPAALPSAPRADGTGFGLASLRERVAGLGGSLEVDAAPGDGTGVGIRLPAPADGVDGGTGGAPWT
ncbi:sensor histidine kinase [Zafaria sp. Z1313]|uniref:sensor histidine kinase n=1 Tax=Zafaria sp. Z1313 TaxID=3423202 RepID=UPI003D30381F